MPPRKKPTLLAQGKPRILGGSARAWRVRLYAPQAGDSKDQVMFWSPAGEGASGRAGTGGVGEAVTTCDGIGRPSSHPTGSGGPLPNCSPSPSDGAGRRESDPYRSVRSACHEPVPFCCAATIEPVPSCRVNMPRTRTVLYRPRARVRS